MPYQKETNLLGKSYILKYLRTCVAIYGKNANDNFFYSGTATLCKVMLNWLFELPLSQPFMPDGKVKISNLSYTSFSNIATKIKIITVYI